MTRRLLLTYNPPAQRTERKCHICGCVDDRACVTSLGPCHWIAWDLCSGCALTAFYRIIFRPFVLHVARRHPNQAHNGIWKLYLKRREAA